MPWKAGYIHAAARFFEAIGGGVHPECNQALESTPGCMLRAYLARAMKRRETIMRARRRRFICLSRTRRTAKCSFSNTRRARSAVTYCARLQSCPRQWKTKAAACEWFICAEPEVSNGADNGVCELRVKPPCKLPPRLELQRFCKRFAAPFYSLAGKVSNKECAKNGQMFDALYQTLWRNTQ